ncbi:hypothetical protein [Haloarchaeobius sp. DT45]|uniref:hypothetical protein n=1 Tax=Haloarchaeobius sp. DT45 TaxID=3446116 RepID=UPI003F6C6A4F
MARVALRRGLLGALVSGTVVTLLSLLVDGTIDPVLTLGIAFGVGIAMAVISSDGRRD